MAGNAAPFRPGISNIAAATPNLMAQNPTGADTHEIPLTTFGGLCTFMSPTALPAGASPDCSDVAFLPGGVSQRPCFQRVLPQNFFGTATVTYGKSFVAPDGTIRNLYLDSAGNLWSENLTISSLPVLLTKTTPGSYAKSITAFGREYIAISDGLHGADIPLQFDGTFLDRVTQDGPGSPPTVASIIIPASQMPSTSTPPPTLTITAIDPDQPAFPNGYFTTLNIYVMTPATFPSVGQQVTISGTGTIWDGGTYPVISTGGFGGAITVSAYSPAGTPQYVGGGTLTIGSGVPNVTMTRVNNLVTVPTATPHQLQVGYLAQISGVVAGQVGGGIASVSINNEDSPGVATVTTNNPHGLVPGSEVSLQGIVAQAIGGGISAITRTGGLVTVTMAAATGLAPGGIVVIAGVSDVSFDGLVTILNVSTAVNTNDTFTYQQAYSTDATSSGGTVGLSWPIQAGATPSYFEILTAPTATTFQVAVSYPDGSWTGGTVSYAWDGTFYVKTVIDANTFQYQQYGPNDSTTSVGTVTPYGQIAPGKHQVQVFFITRQGYTTAPSPPVLVEFNGGQFAALSNIPIGPSNVIARGIAFTGAEGAYFFYIPSVPQINGQIVGTATQINDNTTTSVVLDFGDNALFASLGISIPGNNLANQAVIDGALGFGFYGSRLFAYGQRNVLDGGVDGIGLLNMGFDGGYLPSAPTLPTGWSAGGAGTLVAGRFGQAWKTSATPLTQSMYADYLGVPIATPNQKYLFRAWLATAGSVTATISSASTGFSSTATLTAARFSQVAFSLPMPVTIPVDLTFAITGAGTVVDEMTIIYADTPYRIGMFVSYANNPEAFDAVTGVLVPEDDTHQVMDLAIIRSNLYFLTQDPSGRLHETAQGTTEPAEWTVNEVAANCGTVSAFSLTKSQADDSSAAGGEEFFAWFSSTGIRIFGGEAPEKISQEIQRPKGYNFPGSPPDLGALNAAAQLSVWGLNDPEQKVMWFGIPSGTATGPSVIWQLSYLGLDSAGAIAAANPVHKTLSGKLTATDLGRKWAPWQRPMNGGALMYQTPGASGTDPESLEPVFFGGNGLKPGTGVGHGNVYSLNAAQFTDDDYGGMLPYYVTYAMPDREQEQQLQLGGHMKMVAWSNHFVYGYGTLTITILYNLLSSPWPITGVYPLQPPPTGTDPIFDTEFGGGNCQSQRFFWKFAVTPNPEGTSPLPATDAAFNLTSVIAALKQAKRMPVRGAYP